MLLVAFLTVEKFMFSISLRRRPRQDIYHSGAVHRQAISEGLPGVQEVPDSTFRQPG